ncbi:hypothetical protein RvY_00770 [Ramazzottius varieornatus]|uniref:Bulb-type lectin domain-containing protein n=1 Tax=Ramazzottius varieornatus TaxID=947166 RepID=A0A1D1UDX9_RAMVA|nr:hypothetical protein RvY_00770 [Ramazzottius varieornatus]
MAGRDCLHANEQLIRGQRLYSQNRAVELVLQDDGNLVLYRRKDLTPLWASNTNGRQADQVIMQHDGNLVMYGRGQPIWASNTHGNHGCYCTLQNDGNLVLYNSSRSPVWASNTNGQCPEHDQCHLYSGEMLLPGRSIHSPRGNIDLIMQTDGNLVLYRTRDGHPLWASNTHGRQVREAIMQHDGNLVIHDVYGTPIWASNTHGNTGACVRLQDDGNMCKGFSTVTRQTPRFTKIFRKAQ